MAIIHDIFERLVAFPTVSRDGNIALIRYVADLLGEAGIKVELYPAENGDRASLFASVGPDGSGGIVLSGHTDVVPVDGQAWSSDPFRLVERNGLLHGRGAADMKGFVACALEAIIAASRRPLSRPLSIALSYDEEIGCVGVRPMLASLAKAGLKPDWVLVGEPTGMQVAIGHKGKTALRATCCGRAAHSALAPRGLNAIHLASDLLTEIRALQDDIKAQGRRDDDYDIAYTTLHAGVIHGGTVLNIVPENCTLDFEIRNLAGDDVKIIMSRLFDKAESLERKVKSDFPEAAVRLEVLNEYPGLDMQPDHEAVRGALKLAGGTPLKVAFGTEGGLFQQALGVPVLVCGPGHMAQGHTADEFVSREQIEACRAMLGRVVDSLAK